jgi:uridine kinase
LTATFPNAYELFTSFGLDANLINNLAFSLLQAVLLLNVLWLYRRGVEQSKKQKLYNMPYLIGVAGDSGSGKSTLASLLTNIFGQHNIALIAGDAMHKWERGHSMWQKFTHLNPSANTLSLQDGEHIYRRNYDHETGTFTLPERMESKKLVIFEGLHSFYLSHMQRALDLKIFIMPEEQLRFHWKLRRDITERGYTKELVLEQLRQREPDAEKYIAVQKDHADIVVSLKSELDLTDQLGDDIEVQTYLEIQADTAIPMDQFLEQLSKYVKIEHIFNKDRQLISFRGTIEAEIIERLSFSLTPELYDVTVNPPEWSKNYNGILQLFVCYYIFHTLRFSLHEK